MQRDDISGGEQLFLGHRPNAELGRVLRLQVLAPRDDVHAEGEADPRDLAAEFAEANGSQPCTSEFKAERALPSAAADVAIFCTVWRANARIKPQVNSAVDVRRPVVPLTSTPSSRHASRSMDAFAIPVVTTSLDWAPA